MKHAKYILLLALCLVLTACAPKEDPSSAASSMPDVSQSEADASKPEASAPDASLPEPDRSAPDASEPDHSEPDTSTPDAPDVSSQEKPPLTEADKAAAYDAALDYYLGTVFEVDDLTEIEPREGEIAFRVECSKDGVKVDPDRTIFLERRNGAWTVINEGY